jgi:hypothetical protein
MLVNASNGGSMLVLVLATLIAGQPVSANYSNDGDDRARDRQVLALLTQDVKSQKAALHSDELALSAAYGLLRHDVHSGAFLDAANDVARVNELEWTIVQDVGTLSADHRLVIEDERDLRAEQPRGVTVTPAALMTGTVSEVER